MAKQEVVFRDARALKDTDSSNKPAEITPVFLREEVPKECRAETIDIDLELPAFVSRIKLLCRVSRCTPKG